MAAMREDAAQDAVDADLMIASMRKEAALKAAVEALTRPDRMAEAAAKLAGGSTAVRVFFLSLFFEGFFSFSCLSSLNIRSLVPLSFVFSLSLLLLPPSNTSDSPPGATEG